MGLIEMVKVISASITKRKSFPGKSVYAKVEGLSGGTKEVDYFQNSNLLANPAKNVRLIFVPVNGSQKAGVAVAGHNYQIELAIEQGGVTLFSTNAAGDTVKAKIEIKPDGKLAITTDSDLTEDITGDRTSETTGKQSITSTGDTKISASGNAIIGGAEIRLNGSSKSLVTYSELNSALQTLVLSINAAFATKLDAAGSSPGLTLDISSAETSTVKTGG